MEKAVVWPSMKIYVGDLLQVIVDASNIAHLEKRMETQPEQLTCCR